MVRVWGGRVIRWGLLGLTALILVLYFGRLFYILEHRVKVAEAHVKAGDTALAVAESKIAERDAALGNLHVTVTAPPPAVTVTVAPTAGKTPVVVTQPGATQIVPVPSPFPVPGPTVTSRPSSSPPSQPPIRACPHLDLLGLVCL